jgi:hypothetical protein
MTIMKSSEVSTAQILAIRCPTCGAKPGQKSELSTGQPRNTPHRYRRLVTRECRRVVETFITDYGVYPTSQKAHGLGLRAR